MVGEFDIKASPAKHLSVRPNIGMTFTIMNRETGSEEKVLAWMSRDTLQKWGFEWREEDQKMDPGAVALLSWIGLKAILDMIHGQDELVTDVPVRRETHGEARPRYRKECAYQDHREQGLFCTAASMEDPHGGQTSAHLCEGCRVPDRVLMCSDMQSPRTAWFPSESEDGARDLIQAMCRSGNDPGSGVECLPGVRPCWVKTVTVL